MSPRPPRTLPHIERPIPAAPPSREVVLEGLRALLQYLGEDPQREGLRQTPQRILKALEAYTQGGGQDIAALLKVRFSETGSYGGVVVLRQIRFVSLCEHHLLPFYGAATVAYEPRDAVVGLSKLARLVDVLAARLQLQERLNAQILGALREHLNPRGAFVALEATHTCLTTRGAAKEDAVMATAQGFGTLQGGLG